MAAHPMGTPQTSTPSRAPSPHPPRTPREPDVRASNAAQQSVDGSPGPGTTAADIPGRLESSPAPVAVTSERIQNLCPFRDCPCAKPSATGWATLADMWTHIHNIHLASGKKVPESFLQRHGRRTCERCHVTFSTNTGCQSCRGRAPVFAPCERPQKRRRQDPPLMPTEVAEAPSTPRTAPCVYAQVLPQQLPAPLQVLQERVPTCIHIPRAAPAPLGRHSRRHVGDLFGESIPDNGSPLVCTP